MMVPSSVLPRIASPLESMSDRRRMASCTCLRSVMSVDTPMVAGPKHDLRLCRLRSATSSVVRRESSAAFVECSAGTADVAFREPDVASDRAGRHSGAGSCLSGWLLVIELLLALFGWLPYATASPKYCDFYHIR